MSPDENVVIKCYQILINCLPDEVFSKVLVPLDRWLIHSWDPQIKVISLPYNGIYPSAELQSLIDASLEAEQPDKKHSVNNKASQNVDDSSSYGSINMKTEKSSIHSLTPRSTTDIANLIKSNHSFNIRKSKSDNNPLAAVISSSVFDDMGDDNNSEVDRISISGKSNASPTMKDAKLRKSVTSSSSPLKNTSSHHTKGTLTRASMRKRPLLRKSGSSVRGDLLAGRTLLGDNGISHHLIDDDDSDTAAPSLDEVGNAELQELDKLYQQLQSVLRSVSPHKGGRTSSLDPRPNKAQQLLFLSLPRTNKISNNENNNDNDNDKGGAHTMGADTFSISSPTGTDDVSLTQSQTQVPPRAINSNSNHIPISRTGSKATQLSRTDTGQNFVSTAVAPVKEILQEEDRSSLASTHSGKESTISIKSSLQPRADLSIHPPPPPAREAGSERDGDKMEEKNPTEQEKPKRVLLDISTAQLRAQWFQEEKQHEKNHSTLRY
eukprot:gene29219-38288_t